VKPDDNSASFKGRVLTIAVILAGTLAMALVARWLGTL
jgi:hypothetical protein